MPFTLTFIIIISSSCLQGHAEVNKGRKISVNRYMSGFYLGFEIWGEAIVDYVAIGGGCERGMCSLLRKARKLKHFMT